MITFTFPSLRTLRFVQEFHILRFRFPANDHSDSLHPREFIQTSVVTFKILQTSIFIFHVLINETPSKYEISKYERTGSHLDFLSGVVSCEQVKKEKKKKKRKKIGSSQVRRSRTGAYGEAVKRMRGQSTSYTLCLWGTPIRVRDYVGNDVWDIVERPRGNAPPVESLERVTEGIRG